MMRPVELLQHLVELESPTGDVVRMSHIASFIEAELAGLGGAVDREGQLLHARFGEGDARPILMLAPERWCGCRSGSTVSWPTAPGRST